MSTHTTKNHTRNLILGAIAFVALLFIVSTVTSIRKEAAAAKVSIEVDQNDHIKGDQSAPITLVEFGDYQCPACGAYHPLVEDLITKNPTKVKFVFKHFPLLQIHKNAIAGARAAEAAGAQGKYFEMHDLLYKNQSEWGESITAKESFIKYATSLGLDMVRFEKDISGTDFDARIKADLQEGTTLGITGTPSFYANGVKIEASGYADFEAKILATENVVK